MKDRSAQSVKEKINESLKMSLEREALLRNYFPHLERVELEGGGLFVKDSLRNTVVRIGMTNGKFTCKMCVSVNCDHVQFTLTQPDLAALAEAAVADTSKRPVIPRTR